jgi:hypothetical protein
MVPLEHLHPRSVCGPALEILGEVQQSNPVDPLEDCCNPGKTHIFQIFQMTLGNLNVRKNNLQGHILSSARDSLIWTKQLNILSLNPRLAKSVKAGEYGKTDWSFSTDAKRWPG